MFRCVTSHSRTKQASRLAIIGEARVREWLKAQEQAESLPEEKEKEVPAVTSDRSNYRITEDTGILAKTREKFKGKYGGSVSYDLEIENRLAHTRKRTKILAGYVGWGGLSAFDENNAAWASNLRILYVTSPQRMPLLQKESTPDTLCRAAIPVVIKAMFET